jgi:hypothetical protein
MSVAQNIASYLKDFNPVIIAHTASKFYSIVLAFGGRYQKFGYSIWTVQNRAIHCFLGIL